MTSVIEFPIPEQFRRSPAVANRERLAAHLSRLPPDEIMRNYVYMTKAEAIEEFEMVFRLLAPWRFRGRGFEVGAGVGVFSSMVARNFPEVKSIHAIEVVSGVVRHLQPVVASHVAGERAACITGVIGSFDDLAALGGGFDFCIEIASLHHSNDLRRTLREIAARLRPGGILIALDRAHRNGMPERQRQLMLDLEYSSRWKRENHYPPDPLTRRANGEHEIALAEWEEDFRGAGFEVIRRFELRAANWPRLFRSAVLHLPFALREKFGWLPTRVRPQCGETGWMLRHLFGLGRDAVFHAGVRDHTLFIAKRM